MVMKLRAVFIFFMSLALLAACSDSSEQDEISELEKKQKQIAQESVEYVKVPLEKANLAKEISEEHNRKVDETISDQ